VGRGPTTGLGDVLDTPMLGAQNGMSSLWLPSGHYESPDVLCVETVSWEATRNEIF